MSRSSILLIVPVFLASVAGGVFILNTGREVIVENATLPISGGSTSPKIKGEVEPQNIPDVQSAPTSTEDIIKQAQALVIETQKFIEEEKAKLALIKVAQEKSGKVKGIYIGSSRNVNNFKALLGQTELNGLVVDVKEAYGQNLPVSVKSFISQFHAEDNWLIARVAVFRDSSLVKEKPEWYLASSTIANIATTTVWQDRGGQYWLDPANEEVQNYIIEFSQKAIDYGFDELQFDYIRYPDDYQFMPGQEKIKAISNFFAKLSEALKAYKPSVILSVDLFGYVATQFNSYGIGQSLIEAGKYFDYISFMLYPSHFYGGFSAREDLKRQIPAVYFPYKDDNTSTTDHLVSNNPYSVISRSIFSSIDYLEYFKLKAKVRPWLQNFDLKADTTRGIFYDAEKVRSEISAAEDAGSSGWLLWNPSYIYTKEALKSE
ncbi:MAG: putative glycoside hydrolase [bacterium]|nr:putative glycoside hydrolase [bacterium]